MEIEGDIYCPKHPTVKLTNRLKGNVGACASCGGLFTRALGAAEIERDIPRPLEKSRKKSRKTPAKPALAEGQ